MQNKSVEQEKIPIVAMSVSEGVITDVNHPQFDLEKLLDHWAEQDKAKKAHS
jgi:hypothetical protein